MKGVNNKPVDPSAVASAPVRKPGKVEKAKRRARVLTASDLTTINHRLDQCLPMETPQWQRVEQLLMQLSEFAPNNLIYEAGIAVALYADDQAHRAYILGVEDGEERAETSATKAQKVTGAA